MLSLLIAGVFMVLSVNVYNFSVNYVSLQRTYIGLYKGIVEASVYSYNADGESIRPFFREAILEKLVSDYFSFSVPNCVEYSLYFDFMDSEIMDYSSTPDLVDIYFEAKVNLFYTYDKKARFQIIEGYSYGE